MLREGEPIERFPLSEQIDTGISYEGLLPNTVPEYEQREACIENNYRWKDWQKLDWQERARSVAYSRLKKLIGMHQNEAVTQDMKRRQSLRGE